jgi:hypothetical protein
MPTKSQINTGETRLKTAAAAVNRWVATEPPAEYEDCEEIDLKSDGTPWYPSCTSTVSGLCAIKNPLHLQETDDSRRPPLVPSRNNIKEKQLRTQEEKGRCLQTTGGSRRPQKLDDGAKTRQQLMERLARVSEEK